MSQNKTQQVRDMIFKDILTGIYKPGSRLPTEVQMAALTKISRITIRRAFADLEKNGIIERVQGRGTFVSTSLSGNATDDKHVALLSRLNDPFALEFILHLERELSKKDLLLTLKIIDDENPNEAAAAIELVAKGIRNLIVWPNSSTISEDIFSRLRILGTNIVFFDKVLPGSCADYVGLDHKAAITDLLKSACSTGLDEFVFINHFNNAGDSNVLRLEAFTQYCDKKNLTYRVVDVDYNLDLKTQIKKSYTKWTQGLAHPGLICVNDTIGIALRKVAGSAASIYAIDGFKEAQKYNIISIQQPLSKLASKALQLLENQRKKGTDWKAEVTFIKGTLIKDSK